MRLFIPELSQIRPQWIEAWGEEFGVAGLANAMATNKRLSKRVHEDILKAMNIDVSVRFSEEEVLTVAQYVDDPDRMVRLCGLVLNSEIVRGKIGRQEFGTLSNLFSAEDLKMAIPLGWEFAISGNFAADADRLVDLVENSGRTCIANWKAGLSEQLAMRLMLIDPTDQDDQEAFPSGPGKDKATQIVTALTQAICGIDVKSAA